MEKAGLQFQTFMEREIVSTAAPYGSPKRGSKLWVVRYNGLEIHLPHKAAYEEMELPLAS
jgi:hypothetical protein